VIGAEARQALVRALGERVRFEVPLGRFTSLRVGGPADALASPASREELARAFEVAGEFGLPVTVLGGGFNTLVLDGGLPGLVLRMNRLRSVEIRQPALVAEAGVSHARAVRSAADAGLAGLEFGVGIPGTVGGWVVMNAGIGEREIRDVLTAAEILRPGARATEWIPAAGLGLGYRAARGLPEGAVVVAARFGLEPGDRERIRRTIRELLDRRAQTQPTRQPSCGSVFKNPPGDFAGRLIEAVGLKGERCGRAEISRLHANFIVTGPGARAAEVLTLIERARERVHAETGVLLEPEVRIVGRPG